MKPIKNIIAAAGLAALCCLGAGSARADGAPVYAFVDMNQVLYKSDAGKALREEITRKGQKVEAELQAENKSLNAAAMDYKKSKDGGAADSPEVAKKAKELQKKYDDADRLLQSRRMTLNAAMSIANRKLSDKAVEIIAAIMKEKGYTAVFSHEAVVLAAENQDITQEVLKRMNATVKSIPIDWQAAQRAGAGAQ
jgi:Skp family chaperone for outer membrane proteins